MAGLLRGSMGFSTITVLGSTGSIGTQTLDVIRQLNGEVRVVGLGATGRRPDLLARQIAEFQPEVVHVADEGQLAEVRRLVPAGWKEEFLCGEDGLARLAAEAPAELVMIATVGWTGLEPALAAIEAGRHLALANKEVLVCGGHLVMPAVRRAGVHLLPVDSEHNAIQQCLEGSPEAEVRRLILTCSGGPFRCANSEEIENAGPERTLNHPTWDMGQKITVDSATLMNKGLEVIEAHHLFGVPYDRIEVVIHPQSTIHSMAEFVDGSIIAQLGQTDMRLPIQYALTWPARLPTQTEMIDFAKLGSLTFESPDLERFPCLRMAYEAGRAGGSAPAVLNAANEVAVDLHLEGRIPCGGIPRIVEEVLGEHTVEEKPDLDRLRHWDAWAREKAAEKAVGITRKARIG